MNSVEPEPGCVVAAHSDGIRMTVFLGVLAGVALAMERGFDGEWFGMSIWVVLSLVMGWKWAGMPIGARVIGPKRCECAKHRRRALRRSRRDGGSR